MNHLVPLIAIIFFLLPASQLNAHGENEVGPNGGIIRMPGAWHTELVLDKNKKSARVYLLDIGFKNPMTKNSKLTMNIKSADGTSTRAISCKSKKQFFVCTSKLPLKTGETIELLGERDGQKGAPAVYPVP